ncbi:MAG: hypothetical protein GXP55_06000 [Deltaproteobacteria bacterium]|nr:hypothetical protein [Deltaproteobacteria bacterium]
MNARALPFLLMLPLVAACDRGPEIPPNAEPPVSAPASSHTTAPSNGPAPQGAVPPGHPGASAGQGRPALDPANPTVGGVAWSPVDGLTSRPPSNDMRAAEYVATSEAGEAVLVVSFFPGMGGSVEENVQRWIGQFTDASGQPLTGNLSETVTLHGLSAAKVDVSGSYAGMGGEGAAGQRLLGLIVQAPSGPVFFKFVGPAATVTASEAAFDQLVDSIHPAD